MFKGKAMKNIIKIFLAIALVLCMSLALFACTDNGFESTPTGNDGNQSTNDGGDNGSGGLPNDDDEGTIPVEPVAPGGDDYMPVRPG